MTGGGAGGRGSEIARLDARGCSRVVFSGPPPLPSSPAPHLDPPLTEGERRWGSGRRYAIPLKRPDVTTMSDTKDKGGRAAFYRDIIAGALYCAAIHARARDSAKPQEGNRGIY